MEILTIKDAAEFLAVPVSQVYTLVRQKDFPAFRVGKHWRIPKDNMMSWIEQQMREK